MQLIRSLSDAPEVNCALEATLLGERREAVLLYINRPSVIVGRNQCMEAEADMDYCRREGIRVVRRISGGGAVYHDEGNVNYAFVRNRGTTAVMDTDFTAPVRAALRTLGVEAVVGRRRELLAGGRKISGTAAHVTRNRVLFHGTLLYRTDPERLSRALRGDASLRGRHVASVPGPVANIAALAGTTATTAEFLDMLTEFFAGYWDERPAPVV
jgi:lipoate-protein ligase A